MNADILVWDSEAKYTITAASQSMHTDYSIVEAFEVKSNTRRQVFSRGEDGNFLRKLCCGHYLRREVPKA